MKMDYLFYMIWGYLSGSILFAYLIPWFMKHIDIRELSEDKNPGTFNAFVFGGIGCGITVLLLELLYVVKDWESSPGFLREFWLHRWQDMPFPFLTEEKEERGLQ